MNTAFLKSKKILSLVVIVLIIIPVVFFITSNKGECNTPETFARTVSKVYIRNIKTVAGFTSDGKSLEAVTKQLEVLQKKSHKHFHQCKQSFQEFSAKDKVKAKHLTFTKIQHIYGEEVWQNYIKSFASYPQLVTELYDITNITSITKPTDNK